MPITASAKKALRRDVHRTQNNRRVRSSLKTAVKTMVTTPSAENLAKTYQVLDRAAKNHVIHDNKAARIKSRLSKLVGQTTPVVAKTKAKKKAVPAKKTTKRKSAQ